MRHARADYNRIQDPAGLIPEREPVILFRGQDKFTAQLARIYADMVENDGGDPNIIILMREHAERIEEWQRDVKVKDPDCPDAADPKFAGE